MDCHHDHHHDAHVAPAHPIDHSHHHHASTPAEASCKMSMLWNTDPRSLCLLTPAWRISDAPLSLALSLLAVALLSGGVHYLNRCAQRYQARAARAIQAVTAASENGSDGSLAVQQRREVLTRRARRVMAALSTLEHAYHLLLMAFGMTYNAWVVGAVLVGYYVGYYLFALEGWPGPGTEAGAGVGVKNPAKCH